MKAVQLDQYGPAENFRIVDVPVPEPGFGQVLIKVEVAGIVFADSMMRRGAYVNLPASRPFIPGREVAGVVDKIGGGVTTIKPGARVTASMHTGGYAEYSIASAKEVIHLPDRVSFEQGIVYHTNLRIAYLIYYIAGQVKPQETILLHAPSGGIGTLIIHIARKRANNVIIAVSSSEEKLEWCRAHGTHYGINYKKTDYVEEVLRITGGRGVDVSLNSVSGPTLETDPRAIRHMGRWVIYGRAAGEGRINPYPAILPKALTVRGFQVYAVHEREEFRQATDFLYHWLETEELISVSRTFRLDQVIEAHHWLDEQRSVGKIALIP
jgi:NADPH2:quinone reductase